MQGSRVMTRLCKLSSIDLEQVYSLFKEAFKKDHVYGDNNLSMGDFEKVFKAPIDYSVINGDLFGIFLGNELVSFF